MSAIHLIQALVVGAFAGAVILNLLVQRARGIRAFVLSPEPRKRAVEATLITLLFSWFGVLGLEGLAFLRRFLGPTWIEAPAADVLGCALMLFGLSVGLLAYLHMGRSWRIGIDAESQEKLVTHGVFGWSRNPIYLFIDLVAVGVVLTSGTAFFIATSPLVLFGVHLRILEEERFLAGRHGAEFEVYCARTDRYLGRRS